jgi:hypothetical protein
MWCDVSNVPFGNTEIRDVVAQLDEEIGKILELRDKLRDLRNVCQHNWIQGGYHWASCSECGTQQDGWWCPTSPDKHCHYPGEDEDVDTATDDNVNYDSCIHCGLPSERK